MRLSASVVRRKPRPAGLRGRAGSETDLANNSVAISFGFAHDRITITNAFDENAIEFGPPSPGYRAKRP